MQTVLTEEWREVPGYPAYEVSEHGTVRRCKDNVLRIPYVTIWGYQYLCLRNNGKKQAMGINRIVALAFLGQPPSPKHHAAHFDGDKANNHVSNIRWATRSENERDKVRHGRSNRGEGHGRHKLTKDDVIKVRELLSKRISHNDIAECFNVARTTISSISTGKSWGWM